MNAVFVHRSAVDRVRSRLASVATNAALAARAPDHRGERARLRERVHGRVVHRRGDRGRAERRRRARAPPRRGARRLRPPPRPPRPPRGRRRPTHQARRDDPGLVREPRAHGARISASDETETDDGPRVFCPSGSGRGKRERASASSAPPSLSLARHIRDPLDPRRIVPRRRRLAASSRGAFRPPVSASPFAPVAMPAPIPRTDGDEVRARRPRRARRGAGTGRVVPRRHRHDTASRPPPRRVPARVAETFLLTVPAWFEPGASPPSPPDQAHTLRSADRRRARASASPRCRHRAAGRGARAAEPLRGGGVARTGAARADPRAHARGGDRGRGRTPETRAKRRRRRRRSDRRASAVAAGRGDQPTQRGLRAVARVADGVEAVGSVRVLVGDGGDVR